MARAKRQTVKAAAEAAVERTPIYASIFADGKFIAGNPREAGQWTKGVLVCYVPVPDLRFRDVLPVENGRVDSWGFAGSGVHLVIVPFAAGIVKFQFAGEGDNYFIYDPPRPGSPPTG